MEPERIARAFSGHEFEGVLPFIAADAVWTLTGGDPITGADAIAVACRDSAGYLAGVSTRFDRFRVIVSAESAGAQSVVVDSLAEYTEQDGTSSVVASCDIYDFEGGQVTAITSYTTEL